MTVDELIAKLQALPAPQRAWQVCTDQESRDETIPVGQLTTARGALYVGPRDGQPAAYVVQDVVVLIP